MSDFCYKKVQNNGQEWKGVLEIAHIGNRLYAISLAKYTFYCYNRHKMEISVSAQSRHNRAVRTDVQNKAYEGGDKCKRQGNSGRLQL